MELLVSDYDNTFYQGDLIIKKEIKAVNNFMQKGNLFAINTTNGYNHMNNELRRKKFNPSYLAVSNGLSLFDDKNNVVSAKYIPKYRVDDLLYLTRNRLITLNEYELPSYENIVQAIAECDSIVEMKEIKEAINLYFEELEVISLYLPRIMYIRRKSNKVDSVDDIASLNKVDKENIYTVGDGNSDYEMIKKYNGYCMLLSNPKLYSVSGCPVFSVKSLIKKIEK